LKEREKEEDYNPIVSQLMDTICGMTKLRDFPSTLSYKTIDLPAAVLKLMVTYSREVVLKTKEEDGMFMIETVIQAFIALIDVVDMKIQQQQQQCEEGSSAAANVRFVSFQSRHALLASQCSGIAGGGDNDDNNNNNNSGIYCLTETILLHHRHEKPISSSSPSPSSLSSDEQRARAEYVTNRKTIVRNLFLAMAHMVSHDEVLDRVSERDRRHLHETICQHFNGCGVSFLSYPYHFFRSRRRTTTSYLTETPQNA
jgi:hypothetical protein